jgi:monoterpene epsilon-lactone hydrolase
MPSPEMQEVLSQLEQRQRARTGPPPPLDQVRAAFAPAGRLYPLPEDVRAEEVTAGGAPAYWLSAPGVTPGRVLLYLHGGGYSLGSLRSHGELAARLGRAAGMRVLFLDYRLAPEHPFPAAPDDVLAAWRWLRAQGQPAESIALAGDSAGGGLIMGLLITLRDAGEDLPAAAALMSPFVDMTGEDPATREMIRGMAADYLAGADPRSPLVSPVYADLTELPPLLVLAGRADLLFSDSERLAAAAAGAGVDVTLQAPEGLPHAHPIMLGTPEASEATDEIATFLRKRVS